jgi:16S rRNA (cytosine1402-N4)-methyltransferase
MLREVLAALRPMAGETYVDATFGGGGYTRGALDAADCRVIAIDRDPDALARGADLAAAVAPRLTLLQGRFGDLDALIAAPVDAVMLDIGVSSFQLDEAARGFSFQHDGPLDMRMEKAGLSAADAVNRLSERTLADIIYALGEEDDSRRIARAIVQARAAAPIGATHALAALVERAVGGRKGARTHPATKTFQALRMLVNDELGELARALNGAERILKPDGRLIVVAFHSLEDRLVKTFLFERAGLRSAASRHAPDAPDAPAPSFVLHNRKTAAPREDEIIANPRARSASLRWAIRTAAPAWPPMAAPALPPKAEEEWRRLR